METDVGRPREIPLETALGPLQGRYFGAGYLGVRHSVATVSSLAGDPGRVTALGTVVYPAGWSIRDGESREPHLSSVDAIVLPVLLWEGQRTRRNPESVLRSVRLRAGSAPWTELAKVPIEMQAVVVGSDTSLTSTVGNIRSTLQIAGLASDGGPYLRLSRETEGCSGPESVYGSLYKLASCSSMVKRFASKEQVLECSHRASLTSPAVARDVRGLEGAYWPSLTTIDYLVTMGQLAQATIFEVGALGRSAVDNLWMRSMSIELPARPTMLPASYTTRTRLLRDRFVNRAGLMLHDVLVEATSSTGVTATAALAFTVREA